MKANIPDLLDSYQDKEGFIEPARDYSKKKLREGVREKIAFANGGHVMKKGIKRLVIAAAVTLVLVVGVVTANAATGGKLIAYFIGADGQYEEMTAVKSGTDENGNSVTEYESADAHVKVTQDGKNGQAITEADADKGAGGAYVFEVPEEYVEGADSVIGGTISDKETQKLLDKYKDKADGSYTDTLEDGSKVSIYIKDGEIVSMDVLAK